MSEISKWKQFELAAVNFLKRNYGQYASFVQQGGEDSTIPDILVSTKNRKQFYIETKSATAQSGQFVVLPNYEKKQFVFSQKNKTEENEMTRCIIDYMNQNWETYKDINTSGEKIDMSNVIFGKWITNYYKFKDVKYFISGSDNQFVLIPVDDFSTSFDVTATYRIKKSGTRKLPKKYVSNVTDFFNKKYEKSNILKKGNHTYLNTGIPFLDLDKKCFKIDTIADTILYLSKDDIYPEGYRISIKSNTNNPNIIFSITLKSNISGIDKDTFISQLN